MGLQKVTFNFMVECGSKLAKSLLCSKPVSKAINFKGLKYAPELKADSFIRKVETWRTPESNVLPYAKEGETTVKGHHGFHGANDFYNESVEQLLKDIEPFKDTDPDWYKGCIDFYNKQTSRLLKRNGEFTKLTPQPRNCTAYRGVVRNIGETRQDFGVINAANIGDTIVPTRGFAYASHYKFGTYQYMGSPYDYLGNRKYEPMLIEYKIPKGAQVSSNMEHGGEVVFPALSKFRLVSKGIREIEQLNGSGNAIGSYPYKHVILEYIPEIPLLKDVEQFLF